MELKIKSYLSGKDPIKKTPKGTKYRFFNFKRKSNGHFVGAGVAFFFNDYGDTASYTKLIYRLNDKNKFSSRRITYVLRIKNGRLIIKRVRPGSYWRNVSNNPTGLDFLVPNKKKDSFKNSTGPRDRFRKILIQWCLKNGLTVSAKQRKMSFHKLMLTLCYPEVIYFLDAFKTDNGLVESLPSAISSNLRGIKGLNHGLDRLIGFHGKKLKSILSEAGGWDQKIALARVFKGIVSNDDILKILSNRNIVRHNLIKHIKKARYFFRNYSRETIMSWLSDENLRHYYITDTFCAYYDNHKDKKVESKIVLPDTNNITDIHNIVTAEARRIALNRHHKPVAYTKITDKNKQFIATIDNLGIYLPSSDQELINASATLNNCLSGYTRLHGKNQLILLVNRDGQLTYAISLILNDECYSLSQFYGKHNTRPDEVDSIKVKEFLKQRGVVVRTQNFTI